MKQHTPAPWIIDGDLILGPSGDSPNYCTENDAGETTWYSVVCAQESGDSEQWRADARLIATVPELVEFLRCLVPNADGTMTLGTADVEKLNRLLAAGGDS